MEASKHSRLELANEYAATVQEVFRLTGLLSMTGQPDLSETEINDYVELLDKREPLIQKLVNLKKAIDNEPVDPFNGPSQDCLARAEEQIKAVMAMDQQHKEVVRHIMNTSQSSLKGLRNEKIIRNAYAHPFEMMSSSLHDTRQ